MEKEFQGKCVVVTGGGMGLGETMALKFADHGADIAILDISAKAMEEVGKKIKNRGRRVIPILADVADRNSVEAAFKQILQETGRVDVLINNAGLMQPPLDITELDPNLWDRVVDVNLKGVYNCTRAAGKIMLQQRSGVILNMTSVAGLISSPLVAYGPAKAAVEHLTKTVSRGWADKGIRVNALAPGVALTPMAENALKKGWRNRDTMLKLIPMHEFIAPEDIAEAALFLCSQKARFITGITLPIDAGYIANGNWAAYDK